jgi:hypothetical protein
VPAIAVSADGKTFVVMTRTPMMTRDRGKTWAAVKGLPQGCRIVLDRADVQAMYALDFAGGAFYRSGDGGATFARAQSTGLPSDIKGDGSTWEGAPSALLGTPGQGGDLWFVSHQGSFIPPTRAKRSRNLAVMS